MSAKAQPARKTSAPAKPDFGPVFDALKAILTPYADRLKVSKETTTEYTLITHAKSFRGQPMYFGAVISKSYVSFHLFPVYGCPALLESISPELKKRMQGKSCFNFKKIDEPVFAELQQLVERGFQMYVEKNYL